MSHFSQAARAWRRLTQVVTTQYHYPLAPLNYILQFLSILTVLISVFIRIIVILQHSGDSGDTWPYSLDYVSVPIPPKSWSLGQDGAWFLLQGLNSGFANVGPRLFERGRGHLLIGLAGTYPILDVTLPITDRSSIDCIHSWTLGTRIRLFSLYSTIPISDCARSRRRDPKRIQLDPAPHIHHSLAHMGSGGQSS